MQKQSWSEILIPNIEKSILKKFSFKIGRTYICISTKNFFGTELEVLNFWNWNGTVGTFNFGSELELERNCQSGALERNWNFGTSKRGAELELEVWIILELWEHCNNDEQ